MSRPSVEQVAGGIGAWALDEIGLGIPVYLNEDDPNDPGGPWDRPTEAARSLARAVLALFEPETVTTAAELDALPVGSVVLDTKGYSWQRLDEPDPVDEPDRVWECGMRMATALGFETHNRLPATLLCRGGGSG